MNNPAAFKRNALLWRCVTQNPTTLGLEVGDSSIRNSFTLATIPDAAVVEAGTFINIPRSEFTTSTSAEVPGMPEYGILLAATDGKWKTPLPQLFSAAYGSKASPLVSIPASGVETIASVTLPSGNPIVPLELLHVGFKIRFKALWGKTSVSGGASVYSGHFGWASATPTNNPMIGPFVFTTGTDKTLKMDSLAVITEYTNASSNKLSVEVLVPNHLTGVASTGYVDRSNGLDFTKDARCSFAVDPGAGGGTNTDALYWYEIWLEP